jgi:LPS export ABC transporter protein LptC
MKSSFFTALLLIFFLVSCGEKKIEPQVDLTEGDSIPSQESWGDTIFFTDNGRLQAKLISTHLTEYSGARIKYLDSIKIFFFKNSKTPSSILTADKGTVNDALHKMQADGNVVVTGANGRILKTPELIWLNKKNKIYSDKEVWISDNGEIIEGVGFESDKDLDNYVIRKITVVTSKVK